METPETVPQRAPWTWWLIGVPVLFLVLLLIEIPDNKASSTSPVAPSRQNATAEYDSYCATDRESVSPLLHALAEKDSAAILGLIQRQKAIMIERGTRVYVIDTEAGVATVHIESGYHSGQTCRIWEKYIE
jgi:hypothetical protein